MTTTSTNSPTISNPSAASLNIKSPVRRPRRKSARLLLLCTAIAPCQSSGAREIQMLSADDPR
jgi:hypothetical protein